MGDGALDTQTLSILDAIQRDIAGGNAKLESIESKVDGLDRTLRGSNGDKGLVTEVAVLSTRLAEHIGESSHADEKSNKGKEDPTKYVTWKWFVDKGVMPVIIAALVWILLEVLPNIISHLANGG